LVSGFGLTNCSTYSNANASNVTTVGGSSSIGAAGTATVPGTRIGEAFGDKDLDRRPLVAVNLDHALNCFPSYGRRRWCHPRRRHGSSSAPFTR